MREKEKLHTIQDELERKRDRLRNRLQTEQKRIKNLSPSNPDQADRASLYASKELGGLFCSHIEDELAQVEDALKRLGAGNYGVCARCKGEISEARLSVLPSAQYCFKCQTEMEKKYR